MEARSKCSGRRRKNKPMEAKRNVPAEEEKVLSLHKENKV